MKIQTNGDLMKREVLLISLTNVPAVELREKRGWNDDGSDGELKLSPVGKTQYRTALKAMVLDEKGQPVREERNVSVSIHEPVDLRLAQYYRLDGNVWVTPYSAGNQVGLSIVADRVVPLNVNQKAGE